MSHQGFDTVSVTRYRNDPAVALIEVFPPSGKQSPSLAFLHREDIFEDIEGNEWEIVKAVQCAQTTHNDPFTEFYTWSYKAYLLDT